MEPLSRELDFPYRRSGSLVVCMSESDRPRLNALYENGVKNGVPGLEIVERDRLRELEPNISPDAVAALWAPTGAIVCPFGLTIAWRKTPPPTASASSLTRKSPPSAPKTATGTSRRTAARSRPAPLSTRRRLRRRAAQSGQRAQAAYHAAPRRLLPDRQDDRQLRAAHGLPASREIWQGRPRQPDRPRQHHRRPDGHRHRGQGRHEHHRRRPRRADRQGRNYHAKSAHPSGHHELLQVSVPTRTATNSSSANARTRPASSTARASNRPASALRPPLANIPRSSCKRSFRLQKIPILSEHAPESSTQRRFPARTTTPSSRATGLRPHHLPLRAGHGRGDRRRDPSRPRRTQPRRRETPHPRGDGPLSGGLLFAEGDGHSGAGARRGRSGDHKIRRPFAAADRLSEGGNEMKQVDVLIIGGGPAGFAAAIRRARRGLPECPDSGTGRAARRHPQPVHPQRLRPPHLPGRS